MLLDVVKLVNGTEGRTRTATPEGKWFWITHVYQFHHIGINVDSYDIFTGIWKPLVAGSAFNSFCILISLHWFSEEGF
jgi:hypothetical protein